MFLWANRKKIITLHFNKSSSLRRQNCLCKWSEKWEIIKVAYHLVYQPFGIEFNGEKWKCRVQSWQKMRHKYGKTRILRWLSPRKVLCILCWNIISGKGSRKFVMSRNLIQLDFEMKLWSYTIFTMYAIVGDCERIKWDHNSPSRKWSCKGTFNSDF